MPVQDEWEGAPDVGTECVSRVNLLLHLCSPTSLSSSFLSTQAFSAAKAVVLSIFRRRPAFVFITATSSL